MCCTAKEVHLLVWLGQATKRCARGSSVGNQCACSTTPYPVYAAQQTGTPDAGVHGRAGVQAARVLLRAPRGRAAQGGRRGRARGRQGRRAARRCGLVSWRASGSAGWPYGGSTADSGALLFAQGRGQHVDCWAARQAAACPPCRVMPGILLLCHGNVRSYIPSSRTQLFVLKHSGRGAGQGQVFLDCVKEPDNNEVCGGRAEAQAYQAQLLALASSLPASTDVSSRLGEVRARCCGGPGWRLLPACAACQCLAVGQAELGVRNPCGVVKWSVKWSVLSKARCG